LETFQLFVTNLFLEIVHFSVFCMFILFSCYFNHVFFNPCFHTPCTEYTYLCY